MPKISVIIPCYNQGQYLEEAVQSVLNQTFKDFEIIVVDDNSTDNTLEILNKYNDPRIKIIKGPQKGISAALNLGIDIAQGEYIARMDADDISLPDRFRIQTEFMDENPEIGICGSSANMLDSNGKIVKWSKPINDKDIKTNLLIDVSIIHSTVMMRKSILKNYDLRYSEIYDVTEDFDLWTRASEYVEFHNISESLLCSRMHANNTATINSTKRKEVFLKILKENLKKKFDIEIPEHLLEAFWMPNDDEKSFTVEELLEISLLFKSLLNKVSTCEEYNSNNEDFQNFLIKRLNYLVVNNSAGLFSNNNNDNSILIVSHELSMTGAPLILLPTIKLLKKNGFFVTVLSYRDGPLKDILAKNDIPLILSPESFYNKNLFLAIANSFSLVFVNTVVSYPAIEFMEGKSNIIWWVHEAKSVDNIFVIAYPKLKTILPKANNIFTVSEYSRNNLIRYNENVSILKYGIEDTYCPHEIKDPGSKDKIIFSILGTIQPLKAQDVLISAVALLPDNYKNQSFFNIIGKSNDDWDIKLKKISKNMLNIHWYDFIPNASESEVFKNTDVLICISRDDSDPIVVTEAMMQAKPCLISQNVGQRDLIIDGENGFVVETDNPIALRDKIIEIIDSKEKLSSIGAKARLLYLDNYKLEIFEEKFMSVIQKTLERSDKQLMPK